MHANPSNLLPSKRADEPTPSGQPAGIHQPVLISFIGPVVSRNIRRQSPSEHTAHKPQPLRGKTKKDLSGCADGRACYAGARMGASALRNLTSYPLSRNQARPAQIFLRYRWRGASNASNPTPHKQASRKTLTRYPYQTVCLWPAERGCRKWQRNAQLPACSDSHTAHPLTGVSRGRTTRNRHAVDSPNRIPKPTVSAASKGGNRSGRLESISARKLFQ